MIGARMVYRLALAGAQVDEPCEAIFARRWRYVMPIMHKTPGVLPPRVQLLPCLAGPCLALACHAEPYRAPPCLVRSKVREAP